MQIGPYRLTNPIDGPLGAHWYMASDEQDRPCRVAVERRDDPCWKPLCDRLRLVCELAHARIVPVLRIQTESPPAFAATMLPSGSSLGERLDSVRDRSEGAIIELGECLSATLADAHRMGLVHGALSASCVTWGEAGRPQIDFFSAPASEADRTLNSAIGPLSIAASAVRDLRALGELLHAASKGRLDGEAANLIDVLVLADDGWTAAEVHARFAALRERHAAAAASVVHGATLASKGISTFKSAPRLASDQGLEWEQLGRYRLRTKLGEGALGIVFRGEDTVDGQPVAVKILHRHLFANAEIVRRFRKEARLLSEVRSPFVCGLLDFNEDRGTAYLVLELLEGMSLGAFLKSRGTLPEPLAVAIAADAARGLAEAHRRGIVHRDIKPDNIFLAGDWSQADLPSETRRVKLCDFGLAREIDQSESMAMTQGGQPLGTPLYMAPEQATGGEVALSTDVYALGATLFEMLAGRPPFRAKSIAALFAMHAREEPPALATLVPGISEALSQLVARMLAKSPSSRFADADELLLELERIRRGEPTREVAHPRLPLAKAGELMEYDWSWELEASPAELWPFVSNTERLNRAIGLSAVAFETKPAEAEGSFRPHSRRSGSFRSAGIQFSWREHPFEWIEGKRLCVLREFDRGIFLWMASIVELHERADGGTTLHHRIRVVPRGWFGRLIVSWQVARSSRNALEQVYRRIDAFVSKHLPTSPTLDPFEATSKHAVGDQQAYRTQLDRLVERGVDPYLAGTLVEFALRGSDQEVARMRPLELAKRLEVDERAMAEACLQGAHVGLLELLWDIVCPQCRTATALETTLKNIKSHGRCTSCNLDFDIDFASSIELIFRVHPRLRASETGMFCIGGPGHSPHVAAQVRVAAGERFELRLQLGEGHYRVRGPQLPYAADFQVRSGAKARRGELSLARGERDRLPKELTPGGQTIVLDNDHSAELVVRVERDAARNNALTAARAATLATFRELFPQEVLSADQLVSVAHVVLLATELAEGESLYRLQGDARAFEQVTAHFQKAAEIVRREGGAVVKTFQETCLAVFADIPSAVRAALAMGSQHTPTVRSAVHVGSTMAATLEGKLDYFGATVNTVLNFARAIPSGVAISELIADDLGVRSQLEMRSLELRVPEGDVACFTVHSKAAEIP
ncbi:MAG: protein kinase [Gemmataceae bacterium]|nr:protein kinase [Gemmataceae bacterium]